MRRMAMAVACAAALSGAAARADEGEDTPELLHVHQGFFFHVALGIGGMETRAGATSTTDSMSLSGVAGSFNLAFGGSVTDRLVLGGEVWDMAVVQPDVKVGDTTSSSDENSDVTVVGFGPTIRYTFAPESLNLYLQATPSFTQVTTKLNGNEGESRIGFGARLAIGKEWWMGYSQWGIGVAAHLVLSTNKDKGTNAPTWNTTGAGIDFSATWN